MPPSLNMGTQSKSRIDFEAFQQEAGGAFMPPPFKIHDSGHGTVGGEMGNDFASPGGKFEFLSRNRETFLTVSQTLYSTCTAQLDRI